MTFLLFFIAGSLSVSSLFASNNKSTKNASPNDKYFVKQLKKGMGVAPVKVCKTFPLVSYCEYLGLTFESLYQNADEAIVPIQDEIKFTDFSELPEEYDIWDTSLNPYNVSLVEMKDTVKIDVSNYCPPSTRYVTSDFGFRKWKHHNGIDLKVFRGDTVRCAFDGVVRIVRRDRYGYGLFVVVRHSNGLETLYGHLSKFLVKSNQQVKAGDALGMGGSTGRSSGYHLHLEIRYLGTPINPNDIINFNTHTVNNKVLVLTANHFAYKKEIGKIRYWTIKSGDTLGKIAQRTGVSISKLCSLNGIKRTTVLRIGRRIRYT